MASLTFTKSPTSLLSSSESNLFSATHSRQASCVPVQSSRSSLASVECSSRPKKKCTAHHNKTRPKKHSPSDKNRKPTVYPKPPKAPPIFTFGWGDEDDEAPAPATTPEPAVLEV